MSQDPPPPVPPKPLRMGRFSDEGLIDRGGMGSIEKMIEVGLRRRVAMKTLHPHMAAIPGEVLRFQEEARLTAGLDHPNIPPIHELGIDEQGRPYFTMKFVEGRTLLSLLREPGANPADANHLFDMLQIFLKACDAVAFAHSRGIAHCDLKPMNIMVGAHGAAYVMDWGIARPLAGEASAAVAKEGKNAGTQIEGTAAYMAPEQAQGRIDEIDARTDVFGLGGVLYRILAGRAPYTGDVETQLAAAKLGQVQPPWLVRRDVVLPRKLCEIAMQALSAAPGDRFQTVAALRAAVQGYMRGDVEFETAVFQPGSLVCKEGDEGNAAWVIVSGHAQVYKTFESGRRVLGQLGPGDTFGETAILGTMIRTASVEALDKLTTRVVTRAQLDVEMGRTFWVGQLVKSLAARFRSVNEAAARQGEALADYELREEILRWMVTKGTAGLVPWTPLRLALCRRFQITGADAKERVARLAGFELDADADTLRLLPKP